MTVKYIENWFKEAVPNPTTKSTAVQLGVHLEEVSEMVAALDGSTDSPLHQELERVANAFKTATADELSDDEFDNINRLELLDSLCDQIVTAIGVAHMFGLDISDALNEVNASNWSKFVDGKAVFDANGKIAKGPKYFKPDLARYV